MVLALRVVTAAKSGFCRVDSMDCSSLECSRRWLPTRGLDAELLCVLGVQSLPAAELHGIGADHASNGSSGQEPIQHVEADVPAGGAHRNEIAVDVVPKRQPRAAGSQRLELPADVLPPPVEFEH